MIACLHSCHARFLVLEYMAAAARGTRVLDSAQRQMQECINACVSSFDMNTHGARMGITRPQRLVATREEVEACWAHPMMKEGQQLRAKTETLAQRMDEMLAPFIRISQNIKVCRVLCAVC